MEPLPALRRELAHQRRQGADFQEAWPVATRLALEHAVSGFDRIEWSAALAGTAGCWEAAYTGAPATRPAQICASLQDAA